ncbi:MAG: hypothetical protein CMJ18_21800 [Phycisphaeraceae bacterium]|nr:hypothetical protein [Phycisphaeraceae bacterium]
MTHPLDQPAAFKLVYTPVGHFVNGHNIVRGPDGWHMFYGGLGGADNVVRHHVTSDDLLSWKAHEPFLRGEPGTWDECEIGDGCVLEHGGRWYFVYHGCCENHGSRCIGVAVSDDMWTWTKLTGREVPPFRPDTSWSSWKPTGERQCCKDPWIIRHGDEHLMYYPSRTHAGDSVIAVARSSDLLHWQDEGPIVTVPWRANDTIGPGGFEVPRVVAHGGRYYLFALYFWGLQYWIGDDPFHFGEPRVLGPWHASNIFNDADRWFITHAFRTLGKNGIRIKPNEKLRGLHIAGLIWEEGYPFVTDLGDVLA